MHLGLFRSWLSATGRGYWEWTKAVVFNRWCISPPTNTLCLECIDNKCDALFHLCQMPFLSPLRIGEEEHFRGDHLLSSCGPPCSSRGYRQEVVSEESDLPGFRILHQSCFLHSLWQLCMSLLNIPHIKKYSLLNVIEAVEKALKRWWGVRLSYRSRH